MSSLFPKQFCGRFQIGYVKVVDLSNYVPYLPLRRLLIVMVKV